MALWTTIHGTGTKSRHSGWQMDLEVREDREIERIEIIVLNSSVVLESFQSYKHEVLVYRYLECLLKAGFEYCQ